MKDPLLLNKKLMWAQEEKVQILVAIPASLPVLAEEVTLLRLLEFLSWMLQSLLGLPPALQGNL